MRIFQPVSELFEPSDHPSVHLLYFLLQRLLAGEKLCLLRAVCFPLNILVKIYRKKALEFLGNDLDLQSRRLVRSGRCLEIFSFVLVRHLGKLRRPCFRHGKLVKNIRELAGKFFFSHVELGASHGRFLRASVVGMTALDFCRNHSPALAATEQAAKRTWLVLRLVVRPPIPLEDVLHFVEQTLGDDGFVLAFIDLSAVPKEATIKGVLEDAGNPVPMVGVANFGEETLLGEKLRYVLQTRIVLGIQLKRGLDDSRFLPVHHNRLRALVVDVAHGSERGIFSSLNFFIEAAFRVRGQVENVLVGDAKLHAHHQNVIGRVIIPVVRRYMLNDVPLQKPAHLSAVHRVAGEPIQFPAYDAPCLSFLNTFHHLIEYGTAGHFSRLLFYKLRDNVEFLLLRQSTQDGELVFDGAHLLVLDIG
ncbi:MAG: hypothetical protein AAB601_02240 [Patescibacteria group bacterium]